MEQILERAYRKTLDEIGCKNLREALARNKDGDTVERVLGLCNTFVGKTGLPDRTLALAGAVSTFGLLAILEAGEAGQDLEKLVKGMASLVSEITTQEVENFILERGVPGHA